MTTVNRSEAQLFRYIAETERQISPVVQGAAEALERQHKKPRRIIEFKTSPTPEMEPHAHPGIYIMPNWEGSDLLKIRPEDRGYRVSYTRGASAHDVSFGLVDLRTPKGLETIAVAIKPFNTPKDGSDRNARKAMKDAIANGWVLKRGFSTTDPIAVICDKDSFIVTPVKKGVQALDTQPWHQFNTTDNLDIRGHFVTKLEQVAQILATLNSRGITHIDSQLRNYWVTSDGTMEPFDWESARITKDSPTPEEFLEISACSLKRLYENLKFGNKIPKQPAESKPIPILRGDEKVIWDQFNQYVLEPYVRRLEDLFLESNNDQHLSEITGKTITVALKTHLGQSFGEKE